MRLFSPNREDHWWEYPLFILTVVVMVRGLWWIICNA